MSQPLPVALLAGGLGTRLRPFTGAKPKALVEVAGEPFIAHQLRRLEREGVRRVVVCAGYLGEMIEGFVGDGSGFGLDVHFSYDGERLLGTGGALKQALPLLGEAFFVLYGDSLLPCRFSPVQDAFLASGKQALMTVFRNDDRWDRSNVEFADGRIRACSKREQTPSMRHIDYGLGVLRALALDELATGVPCDLEWVYQQLLARDQLAAFEVHERFYEVGSPEGLKETEAYLTSMGSGLR